MRIASVSDLHTDFPANQQAVVALATEIHRRSADAVIIAGDISHKDDRIRRVMLGLKEVAPAVAYVPGNHDLWFDVPSARTRPELDTWKRYRSELRAIAEQAGVHYLPADPLVLGNVAIVGCCGWYDYSFVKPWLRRSVDDATLASKQYGGVMWTDARLIAFRDAAGALMSDADVARRMEADLRAHLTTVEAREDIEHVIVVTHHQPFDEVVHRTGTLPWEFFTAYMGSRGLGDVIRSGRKVHAAIYGHSHLIGEHLIDGLRVYGTALGYPRERHGVSEDELKKTRIGWIEL